MNVPFPRWSAQTKLVVSLLLLALFVYLLFRLRVILIPLILAIILAYLLSPLAGFFQARLHVNRLIATALCYLLILAILAILPISLMPLFREQTNDLNLDIQILTSQIQSWLARDIVLAGYNIDGKALFAQVTQSLQVILQPAFGKTLVFAVDLLSSIVWLIFITVVSFYLVKDGPILRQYMENLVPPSMRPVYIHLRGEINEIWSAFFRGQLVLALVVAVIFTAAGFVLGLPFALAMGVFAGLMEFLPSLGHGIWLVVASLIALFVGSNWLPVPKWAFMLIIIGLHLFYQQFDLNYLIPRIIGRRVHLPPVVVILGIVSGAVLGGILGISLAAPTIASIRVLGRYVYANLFDLEPQDEDVAPALPPPNPRWWMHARPGKVSAEKGK